MTNTPPIREMIRNCIEELGGRATNRQIKYGVLARYPGANPNSVSTQITCYTVNSPSRVHLPENSKPRRANDPRYDFLFRVARGEVELYDPSRHGEWEILLSEDGRLHVGPVTDPADRPPSAPSEELTDDELAEEDAEFVFSLERHLRDFLAANLGSLSIAGAPLRIYVDDRRRTGVEYPTGVGPIDILAQDAAGNLVVFELKLGRGPDAAVGQLARYMGWVKREMAGERAVRGVIVAKEVDEKLRYAASIIPNVALFEYEMTFRLQEANQLGDSFSNS